MVQIMSSSEYKEIYNMPTGQSPEIDAAIKVVCSDNEYNPIIGLIYENEMWVIGCKKDQKVSSLDEVVRGVEEGEE